MKYLGILLLLVSTTSFAGLDPVPTAKDHRVRIVPYDRGNVVQINCHYDVETIIEYAADEDIERISSGQSSAWALIPALSKDNVLSIQPRLKNADTNLTVITNKRTYLYELHAREQWNLRDNDITFFIQYEYPGETTRAMELALMRKKQNEDAATKYNEERDISKKIDPSKLNLGYQFSGDTQIAPIAVFDDGTFTYFKFDNNSQLPAIYTVDRDRNESVLNYRIEKPYLVVEQLADRFTLRAGQLTTSVFRGDQVVQRPGSNNDNKRNTQPEW